MGYEVIMASKREETLSTARELRGLLDAALVARNRAEAVNTVMAAVQAGRIDVADLYTLVLSPLMADTGAAWQSGSTSVWQEHHATSIVRTIVEALYPIVAEKAAAAPRRDEAVVLACPPGEQHDLGLRMLADRFALAGFDAYFLGADSPVAEIADAARTLDARVVVLSAATHFNRALLRREVAELAEMLPGVRLVVGGPAFVRDAEGFAELFAPCSEFGLPGEEPPSGGA